LKQWPDYEALARGIPSGVVLFDEFGVVYANDEAARLFALTLFLNIVALGLFFVIGPRAPVAFWAVNGWLLGREFFMQVALRRLPRAQAVALRRRFGWQIWLAGALMAAGLTLPLANLLVPVLASASFTHSFARFSAQT
jgi:uncharacterized protein involved in cysteine biosynthesis